MSLKRGTHVDIVSELEEVIDFSCVTLDFIFSQTLTVEIRSV